MVAVTNSMSTQISGEDEAVFSAIQQALRASYAQFGRQVLVPNSFRSTLRISARRAEVRFLEVCAVCLALAYVILAIFQRRLCWIAAIASAHCTS